MTIIIHGATGAQGAPVAAALRHAGIDFTAAVRNPADYSDGAAVAVDYNDPESLRQAYEGADGVFVHLPLGTPEQQLAYAQAILEGVEKARPARVVLSTSGYPIGDDDDQGAISVLARGLERSTVSTAIITPRIFLENLLLPPVTGPAREEGVLRYPIREDYAISWVSHLDMADVAVRLLQDHSVTGRVSAGALPGLLGADVAAGFAEYFGRDVRFETQAPEEMGAALAPLFGEDAIAPVVASYHWRRTQPHELISEDNSAQKLLGITPRTVSQWLREVNA